MPYKVLDAADVMRIVIDKHGPEFLLHDNNRDMENALNLWEKEGYTLISAEWNPRYHYIETVLLHKSAPTKDAQ